MVFLSIFNQPITRAINFFLNFFELIIKATFFLYFIIIIYFWILHFFFAGMLLFYILLFFLMKFELLGAEYLLRKFNSHDKLIINLLLLQFLQIYQSWALLFIFLINIILSQLTLFQWLGSFLFLHGLIMLLFFIN